MQVARRPVQVRAEADSGDVDKVVKDLQEKVGRAGDI